MPEDLYGDEGSTSEPAAMPKGEPADGEGKEPGEEETAILPKSILMGKKFEVGDEVVLRITGIHENEISVAYAEEKKGKESEGEATSGEEGMAPAPEASGSSGGEGNSLYS